MERRESSNGGFKVFATIYPDFVVVLLPAALVTVKLIVYFPAAEYVSTGYSTVEYVISSKFHFLAVGDPVLKTFTIFNC
jgi:hypothetical protein